MCVNGFSRKDSFGIGKMIYLGVDVQVKHPCTYYVLDQNLKYVTSGCLSGADPETISQHLRSVALSLLREQPGKVAADSGRTPGTAMARPASLNGKAQCFQHFDTKRVNLLFSKCHFCIGAVR